MLLRMERFYITMHVVPRIHFVRFDGIFGSHKISNIRWWNKPTLVKRFVTIVWYDYH